MKIPFDNQYISLGDKYFTKITPQVVTNPSLIRFNEDLANTLGVSIVDSCEADVAAVFSGNTIPEGAEPIAMAYAGHQFGHFVPQLGDGRAVLLGDITARNGASYGLQLKGSGQTSFSRNGDGRAALGPVLREYLVSEAMFKLNVPTTRALAAVTTGEEVARERLLPGAVITRVASSFVRVGTFEYFRARGDEQSIQKLADFVIQKNYPTLVDEKNPYVALLQVVVERQAALIAHWMQLGFIHGVMNTDNMSISGQTIDYGPCAFMDAYQHDKVFSSIDRHGRYAYSNQPSIGLWNLTRLAECFIPLFSTNTDEAVEIAQNVLRTYIDVYQQQWLFRMRSKCGLTTIKGVSEDDDRELIESLFDILNEHKADFTLFFYYLSHLNVLASKVDQQCRDLFVDPAKIDEWLARWRTRLTSERLSDEKRQSAMQKVNPVYIPRNHQIEAAIRAAEDQGDFSVFHELHEVLNNPFELQQGKVRFQSPPEANEEIKQTFCGT